MKKNKNQFRQGDVLIEYVPKLNTLPGKSAGESRVILAHGEVTGHAHEIESPELATLQECKDAVALLGDLSDAATMTNAEMVLSADTAVKHQEHGRIPLKKGNAVVRRQREYHPAALRNVQD